MHISLFYEWCQNLKNFVRAQKGLFEAVQIPDERVHSRCNGLVWLQVKKKITLEVVFFFKSFNSHSTKASSLLDIWKCVCMHMQMLLGPLHFSYSHCVTTYTQLLAFKLYSTNRFGGHNVLYFVKSYNSTHTEIEAWMFIQWDITVHCLCICHNLLQMSYT